MSKIPSTLANKHKQAGGKLPAAILTQLLQPLDK
jgi:hypothetical protein